MEKKAFSRTQNTPESPAVHCPMEEQRKELAKLITVGKKKGRSRINRTRDLLSIEKRKHFSKQ